MQPTLQGSWVNSGGPVTTDMLQGSYNTGLSPSPQTAPTAGDTSQSSSVQPIIQPSTTPMNAVDPTANQSPNLQTTSTAVDPAVAAANAAKAAQEAQAASLRSQIQQLAQSVKDIYNGRYGQVDASAQEQEGKLNTRFGNESSSLSQQINQQNEDAGAASAGNGVYDSSYRANDQDRITQAGNQQIGALGNELQDNLGTIAQWVASQKSGFDAGKSSVDTIVSHLAEETDPNSLMTLRNAIDNQISTLQAQAGDNNTTSQNMATLEQIAPSSPRAQQLQTTLQTILGGNADPNTKAAIGSQLIASAQLTPEDQSKLLQAFHTSLGAAGSSDQQPQLPTA